MRTSPRAALDYVNTRLTVKVKFSTYFWLQSYILILSLTNTILPHHNTFSPAHIISYFSTGTTT